MKYSMCSVAALMVLAGALGCAENKTYSGERSVADTQVQQLFVQMEAGEYPHWGEFPKLTWEHIPALLKRAESNTMLKTFPVNGLSSQRQAQCSEGMVALWLVEGIRKEKKPDFASLNPLCLPTGPQTGNDWNAISEKSHAKVVATYWKWWKDAGAVSEQKGRQTNPLEGTGVYWY